MSTVTIFALRPLERNAPSTPSNTLEGSFRVHLAQKELRQLGLSNGDLVHIKTSAGFKGYGVAWTASQTNPGNKAIAKVSDILREQYQLPLNDPVFIEKAPQVLKPLKAVCVALPDSSDDATNFSSRDELLYWVRHALGSVGQLYVVCCHQ